MSRILHVFNRYVFIGGEEKAVDFIEEHLRQDHEVQRCFFESRDWTGPDAPGRLTQLRRSFYNPESRAAFERACDSFKPDAAVFHNTLPVGSPSLYHTAQLLGLPVIHFVHNFRPFSVGGTLWSGGSFMEEALRGDYRREVMAGAWQGSRLKSAVMALILRRLHRSGWLDAVKAWVCISAFMQEKLVHGAGVPFERTHVLRHPWVPQPQPPPPEDAGHYLFLARLVEVKGVEVLLRAWTELEKKLGDKTPALWIGGEGPLEGLVRAAAERSRHIRPLGLVQGAEKQDAIRRCRAMLAPSIWWEPLGLVTYEAYDSAKPMLAARSGGLTETVMDGETGFLHEPGDVRSLVESILRLERLSPEARMSMGDRGRRWLLANADVESWRRGFSGILGRVLADRPA